MPKGRAAFKQRDVTRAARAAMAAGLEVQRVEIDRDGKVTLVTSKDAATVPADDPRRDWDGA